MLFPHLNVLENVAFAPRSAGRGREAARAAARSLLSTVGAADLESARPTELSGGQAQRVAVARALGAEPQLLLLDEPLASLDVESAPAIRRVLQQVLKNRSAIIVTHEVLDALSLADRVAVMNHGSVVETGPTREVLERPRYPFTARLAGINLVRGVSTTVGVRAGDWTVFAATSLPAGIAAAAAFRPTAVTVHTDRPSATQNVVPVVVDELEPRGDLIRLRGGDLFADLTPGRAADLDLWPGRRAYFVIDPADITTYPLERQLEQEIQG